MGEDSACHAAEGGFHPAIRESLSQCCPASSRNGAASVALCTHLVDSVSDLVSTHGQALSKW